MEIDRKIQSIDSDDIETLYSFSAEIQQMIIRAEVPADLVHSYASGLDPHISLEAARLQTPCVARAGSMDTPVITGLVEKCAEKQYFGLSRDSSVKILELNMVLDAMSTGR